MSVIEKYFTVPQTQKIGIYAIRNTETGMVYIGSSVNVYKRMREHARNMIKYGGVNSKMGEDIHKKTDLKNFVFEVIYTFEDGKITDSELRKYETACIKSVFCIGKSYNVNNFAYSGRAKGNKLLYCKKIPVKREEPETEEKKTNIIKYEKKREECVKRSRQYQEKKRSKESFEAWQKEYEQMDISVYYKHMEEHQKTKEKQQEKAFDNYLESLKQRMIL